jgi:TonB family protein
VLLEPPDRKETGLGAAVSLIIHVVAVLVIVIAYRSRPVRSDLVDQFITFLVPPARQPAQEGSEGVAFGSPAAPGEEDVGTGTGIPTGTGPVDEPAGDTTAVAGPALPPVVGDSVLTEIEVDSTVQRYPWSAAPQYPPDLLSANIQGSVSVTYVVDTTGFADSSSLRVVDATHPGFEESVRKALPGMRFRPALLAGYKVRQLVAQTFTFRIRRAPGDSTPPGGE